MNDTTPSNGNADLAAKKLPELQAIASSIGIKNVRKLRKGELIEAIRTGAAPAGAAGRQDAAEYVAGRIDSGELVARARARYGLD